MFFTTRAQLLPEDQDDLVDLYDAREEGGFPPPVPPTLCTGEGCKPAPSLAPVFPGAASSSFSGPGNLIPPTSSAKPETKKKAPKCAKGKTRKHRKCIKVKHRKRSKAKKGNAKHKQARR